MRKLPLLLLVLPLLAVPTWKTGNALALEYNRWAQLREARTLNTLSTAEFMQWQKVKSAWRQMEKQVDAEYRGDR